MKGWLIFKHVILNLHIQNKYTYDIQCRTIPPQCQKQFELETHAFGE